MHKNNSIKSKKSNGVPGKGTRTSKSIPSRKPNAATRTPANSSAARKTSRKNTTWMDSLERFPEMGRQFQQAIDSFQVGALREAARLLERTIADYPDQAPLLWYLGGIYQDLGKPDLAIPHLRRATQIAPKSERASLGLFHALWDIDQIDAALEEVKRFQLLTDWKCQDYLEIMAEIKEKWLDDKPKRHTTKKKTRS
ncbi:MAG: hypothetical protein HY289_01235 [Planctomycetes bacterium]|nr:hypothetical protein [Planctomycetota bacterium]